MYTSQITFLYVLANKLLASLAESLDELYVVQSDVTRIFASSDSFETNLKAYKNTSVWYYVLHII